MKEIARKLYFSIALVTLFCGLAFYTLFRSSDLLIWNILPRPIFMDIWKIQYPKYGFISILIGSGPDVLWFFSGICFLRGLWYFDIKNQTLYIVSFYLNSHR